MAMEIQELKLGERPWRRTSCCPTASPVEPVAAAPAADTSVTMLKALADETRLTIVRMLSTHGEPLCVCHIVDSFELSQPTISHHLKLLRQAGLIRAEKRGLWAYYSLNRDRIQDLASVLAAT